MSPVFPFTFPYRFGEAATVAALTKTYRPSALCTNYSGVVIEIDSGGEESAVTSTSLNLSKLPLALGSKWWYQTFRLPEDYKRGTKETEELFPSMAGFQLLVSIARDHAADAELNYKVQQYFFGTGWDTLTHGTMKGVISDGYIGQHVEDKPARVWIDIIFEKEIAVDDTMVPDPKNPKAPTEFRLGFQNVAYVESVWYTEPNPYAHGEAVIE